MEKIELSTKSVNELKALVYDDIAYIEQLQNNIKLINNELAGRHGRADQIKTVLENNKNKK